MDYITYRYIIVYAVILALIGVALVIVLWNDVRRKRSLALAGAIVLLVCLVFLAIPLGGGKVTWETTADTVKSETPESALVIRMHDGRRDSTEDWDTIHMDKMYIIGLFDEDGNPVPYTIEDIDAE